MQERIHFIESWSIEGPRNAWILIIPTRRTEDAHLEHSRVFTDALLENSSRIWKRGRILLWSFRCMLESFPFKQDYFGIRGVSRSLFGRIRARPKIKLIITCFLFSYRSLKTGNAKNFEMFWFCRHLLQDFGSRRLAKGTIIWTVWKKTVTHVVCR